MSTGLVALGGRGEYCHTTLTFYVFVYFLLSHHDVPSPTHTPRPHTGVRASLSRLSLGITGNGLES